MNCAIANCSTKPRLSLCSAACCSQPPLCIRAAMAPKMNPAKQQQDATAGKSPLPSTAPAKEGQHGDAPRTTVTANTADAARSSASSARAEAGVAERLSKTKGSKVKHGTSARRDKRR